MLVYLLSIFAGFLAVVYVVLLLKRRKTNPKQIPGLKSRNPIDGNNDDIAKMPHFTLFLHDLHKKFGPIASFWTGKQYSVSVTAPEYLKQQRLISEKPMDMFDQFRILLGDDCFVMMNGEEPLQRRKIYDHHFMLKACKSYADCFLDISHEYVEKWKKITPEDHIPLYETCQEATLKGILISSLGHYFKDEDKLRRFQAAFSKVNKTINISMTMDPEDRKLAEEGAADIRSMVKEIMDMRRDQKDKSERDVFIDVLLEDDISESQRMSDSVVFINGGQESTATVIMWILYELATHPDIQEKLHDELKFVLGNDPVSLDTIPKLTYLRQIIDETMRLRIPSLFTARVAEKELKLGDYVIPAGTILYQTVGVTFGDPKIWPEPEKFDPDRFSPKNSKERHSHAFKPFGFAGKRQCPGQTYAYTKMSIYLAEWCRHFRFKLVPGQTLRLVWRNAVRPEDEVWVTIEQRE